MNNFEFTFEFPEPAGVAKAVVACFLLCLISVLAIPGLVLLIIRRNHRVLRHRYVFSLCGLVLFNYVFTVVQTASILAGKPQFCEAVSVFWAAIPFFALHSIFMAPMTVLQADKERIYSGHITRSHKSLHVVRQVLTPFGRALISVVMGGFFLAMSLVAEHLIVIEGDCNREVIIAFLISAAFFFTLTGVFYLRLWKIQDPFFLRAELFFTALYHLPVTFGVTFLYGVFPQIFPAWFDIRFLPYTFPVWTLNLLFPLLLTEPKFEEWLKAKTGRQVLLQDEMERVLRDFTSNRVLLEAQKPERDFLQVVLDTPDLLDAFTEFCRTEWSQENIKFYNAIRDFRNQTSLASAGERMQMAQEIWKTYLDIDSNDPASVEVNLEDVMKKSIRENLDKAEVTSEVFTPAQRHVYNLMSRDSFQRCCHDLLFMRAVERYVHVHIHGMHKHEGSHHHHSSDRHQSTSASSKKDQDHDYAPPNTGSSGSSLHVAIEMI